MPETKKCQNCHNDFLIEDADFTFYKKIDVPPPTFCPECRLQRRLAFRNEKKLYKRQCSLTGKNIISIYDKTAPFPVYEVKEWFSDKWDPLSYGREYDFSKPFFQQYKEFIETVPHMSLMVDYPTLVNSEYTNYVGHLKNCYLITEADFDENCAYASVIKHSRDSFDVLMGHYLEQCYECINCRKCSKTYFSEDCEDCIDVQFSKNLAGCSYCVGCVNLRKRQYHIFNRPYTKDEYFVKLKELNLNSHSGVAAVKSQLYQQWQGFPHKFMHERHNVNVTGDYIYTSKNAFRCNEIVGVENGKFCNIISLPPVKDCYDYTEWGNGAERLYECLTVGEEAGNVRFSILVWPSVHDVEYSYCCLKSSYLFGCFGIRSKQYCIFNKQYSEAEFKNLREKIIQHMNGMPYTDARGCEYRYGEFFPIELSPFGYNETNAHQYFPLSRDEATASGYQWRDTTPPAYSVTRTASQLPDFITDCGDTILNETIGCEHNGQCEHQCTHAFRLIAPELGFLKQANIPLPRLCPNCRHGERIARRNPLRYWHRTCQCSGTQSENGAYKNSSPHFHGETRCPNEFETSYSPDRKEIIYCEKCYQEEVL